MRDWVLRFGVLAAVELWTGFVGAALDNTTKSLYDSCCIGEFIIIQTFTGSVDFFDRASGERPRQFMLLLAVPQESCMLQRD